MSRFLFTALTLTVALGLVGCDEPSRVRGESRILGFGADASAAIDMQDAGAPPWWGADASYNGADASSGADAGVNDPDAGQGVTNDDAGATSATGCMPADCGAPPSVNPICYNGLQAASTCERWVDGTCRWQLVCGP